MQKTWDEEKEKNQSSNKWDVNNSERRQKQHTYTHLYTEKICVALTGRYYNKKHDDDDDGDDNDNKQKSKVNDANGLWIVEINKKKTIKGRLSGQIKNASNSQILFLKPLQILIVHRFWQLFCSNETAVATTRFSKAIFCITLFAHMLWTSLCAWSASESRPRALLFKRENLFPILEFLCIAILPFNRPSNCIHFIECLTIENERKKIVFLEWSNGLEIFKIICTAN